MAQYSSGIATKQKILDVCKDLFYNKGYIDTTYKDICNEAQVHPGSIAYHFDSKRNIAKEIYNETMSYFMTIMPQLFPNEEELTYLILQLAAHQWVFYNDAHYRRFSMEYETENYSVLNLSDYTDDFSNVYAYVKRSIGKKKADFYFAAYSTMGTGMDTYINTNIDTLTFKEVVAYTNEVYYSFVPNDELNQHITRALELIKLLDIKNKGFDMSIELKK